MRFSADRDPAFRTSARSWFLYLLPLTALVAQAGPALAGGALPTGGQFTAGSGAIGAATGGSLTINQSSARGIIDWNSFSIGAGNKVSFLNGGGATLNRVTGGSLSQIMGSLSATGSLYLINPQGIVVGAGGKVVTGGSFVASSRDVSDPAFMAGGSLDFLGASAGQVTNQGSISALGGDILLIGHDVTNTGSLSAPQGTAGLAVGEEVLYQPVGADQRVFVKSGSGDVTNKGSIAAAQAELRAAGGNVYALAGNNGGIIRATGTATRAGHVWLTAGGKVTLDSDIVAHDADGKGGEVETSGSTLSILGGTIRTGNWLIDPTKLTIDAPAATTIDNDLNVNTNVTLTTSATGASSSPPGIGTTSTGPTDPANIVVASNIAWSSSASLTLNAYNTVVVNSGVTITGSGTNASLTLRGDNSGRGTGTVTFQGAPGRRQVDLTGSGSSVSIYYNPADNPANSPVNTSSYTAPTTYRFGGGQGWVTAANVTAYMLVNTAADLQDMKNNLAGDYALSKSINASATASWNSGAGFLPVGSNSSPFTGILDGQGFSVSSLTINSPAQYVGLFGDVGSAGIVRNLTLTSDNVTASFVSSSHGPFGFAGAIAGENEGTLTNVTAGGSVSGSGNYSDVGGLVGYNTGSIANSSTSGSVTGSGRATYLGGLAAENNGVITGSSSAAAVNETSTSGAVVGGLVGLNDPQGSITSSSASGSATGTGSATYVGGLVGQNDNLIQSSSATGNVSGGGPDVGGLVGDNYTGGTVSLSSASGSVSGSGSQAFIGGLVGENDNLVTQSSATGPVTGSGFENDVGGLVGGNVGQITRSFATGSATDTAANGFVGGLVGLNERGASIAEAYAKGPASNPAGGSDSYVGGLVGYTQGSITQTYSIGAVTGGSGSSLGGLIGGKSGGSTTSSYWNTQTSGRTTSAGGTGETTAQLTSGTLPAGFSSAYWGATAGSYPFLK